MTETITQDVAYSFIRQEERFQIIQRKGLYQAAYFKYMSRFFSNIEDLEITATFDFIPMSGFMICPEALLIDKFKPYILVAYDYKVSQRFTTTHFHELISRN